MPQSQNKKKKRFKILDGLLGKSQSPNKTSLKDFAEKKDLKEKDLKLIFVGSSKDHIKKIRLFAKSNKLKFYVYSEEEWATLEEIDQHIKDEEFSKQVVTLPAGKGGAFCFDMLEEDIIKKALDTVDGNIIQAAKILKIARSTLYRKIERYSLNLKEQRDEIFKRQQEKNFKKTA